MRTHEDLPGSWADLHLASAEGAIGLATALGWLAGALSSGFPLWTWPALGWFLLGLFLAAAVWGRLWVLMGERGPPPSVDQSGDSTESGEAAAGDAVDPPNVPRLRLPYTEPGSLSADWGTVLGRIWCRLRDDVRTRRRWWVEVLSLGGVLLVLAGLWGLGAFLVALAGLALLGLRRLVRRRPAALSLLHTFGGLAWPWWLGQAVWAPLTGASLLLSLLWGVAYAGWVDLVDGRRPTGRRLLWIDLAQGGAIAFFLLSGRPVIGGILAFVLLGQGLLQAGLGRAGRWPEIAGRTWPFAAAGVILVGLTLGGWV